MEKSEPEEKRGRGRPARTDNPTDLHVEIAGKCREKLEKHVTNTGVTLGRGVEEAIGLLPDPPSLADKLKAKGRVRKSVAAEIRDL